jgi:hypothetical protein
MTKDIILKLDLQLFAEGSGTAEGTSGVTGTDAASPKGDKNSLADMQYGIQPESAPAAEVQEAAQPDRNAEFEKLIRGEYKDQYNQRVQDTIQKRLKGTQETVDKFNSMSPMLEMLSRKYGVDAADVEALTKAIQEDDAYYEEEAMEMGVSVQQLKEIRRLERENAEFKRMKEEQESQARASQLVAAWQTQAEQTKSVYPSFDMEAEMQNPQFVNLLRSNVDVRTAFEVLHKDEIIPAAMQYTAQQTKSKIAKSIASGTSRPAENGISSQSAARVKSDVTQLSKADREEIYRRAARGEKITFG